jgi:hypothetical protein
VTSLSGADNEGRAPTVFSPTNRPTIGRRLGSERRSPTAAMGGFRTFDLYVRPVRGQIA